jgi:hypothetical protein
MNLQPSPLNLDNLLLRLGLLGAGLLAFNAAADLWAQNDPPTFLFGLALSALAWLFGSACFVLACASRLSPRWVWLVLGVCLFTQLAYAYLAWWNYTPLTAHRAGDEVAAGLAAQALSGGNNPYESNPPLTQPPLPALALWALGSLGLGGAKTLNFIFCLIALSLIFINASPQLRPVILLPLLLWKPFLLLNLNEINGMMWGALLAGVAFLESRPRWQAALFGLACSVSQQVWLAAPFFLIRQWRATRNTKYAIRYTLIAFAVFALLNAPFILWNFGAWRAGMFALEPQFNSHGLATLTQYGLLPLPAQLYSTFQIFAFAAMLAFCWRRNVGPLVWLFPPILLWLSPRGLTSNWLYWLLPFLATGGSALQARWPVAGTRFARSVGLGLAALFALVAAFISTPAIEARLSLPFETSYADQPIITRLKLTVTNLSETMLTPRFAVQRNTGSPPLAWQVDSGPARLAPGESADYVISAGAANKAIPASGGGLVVVSDDTLRVAKRIPADSSFVKPAHIANPNFYFWGSGTNAPEGWRLELPGGASGAALVQSSGEPATLVLSARAESGPTSARLIQRIAFPDSLAVWVHPGNLEVYGLEFDDGSRVLRLLFGEAEGREMLSATEVETLRLAPLSEWSKQEIDLPELYAELGWPLPPFSTRRFRGIEYQARQIEMSLLAASSRSEVTAWFGPIEQSEQTLTASAFVSEALAHPDTFYLTLGGAYCRQRNDNLAEAAYRRALSFNANAEAPPCVQP